MYCHLQNLLLKATQHKEYQSDLDFVTEFYDVDVSASMLESQLQVFATKFTEDSEIRLDIIKQLKLSLAEKDLLSEVGKSAGSRPSRRRPSRKQLHVLICT